MVLTSGGIDWTLGERHLLVSVAVELGNIDWDLVESDKSVVR